MIRSYDDSTRYGFITACCRDRRIAETDIFFFRSQYDSSKSPCAGQVVSFNIIKHKKGLRAENVRERSLDNAVSADS